MTHPVKNRSGRTPILRRSALGLLGLSVASIQPAPVLGQGQLDPAFSEDGWQTISLAAEAPEGGSASRVLALHDGRTLVAGDAYAEPPSGAQFCFARLDADGTVDPTFDEDGILVEGFDHGSSNLDSLSDFDVSPGGQIVAVGLAEHVNELWEPVALRLRPGAGSAWEPDPSFSGDGKFVWPLGGGVSHSSRAVAVEVLDDSRIVAAGVRIAGGDDLPRPWVSRLRAISPDEKSTLDPSFGEDGLFFFDTGSLYIELTDVAIDRQNRILLAGLAGVDSAVVFRLLSEGNLDPEFAKIGWRLIDLPGASVVQVGKIVGLDDGSLYLIGSAFVGQPTTWQVFVVKLTSTGELDSEYGADGFAWVAPGAGFHGLEGMTAIAQGDGRLLVAGGSSPDARPSPEFFVLRLDSVGTLDPTFGEGGIAALDAYPAYAHPASAVQGIDLQSEGHIVIAGTCFDEDDPEHAPAYCLARLLNDYVFADGFETGSSMDWSLWVSNAAPEPTQVDGRLTRSQMPE